MSKIVYFEDVKVGDQTEFGPLNIGREEIIAFADEFDPQPFHLSDEAAAQTHFGSLAASGWHTTALCMKMMVARWQKEPGVQAASLGAIGVDELRWLRPVRPGDTLRGTSEVVETKASKSRPEMGVVKSRITLFNQRDEPVMTMIPIVMFRTRPA
ncbi:acyl dehydratase [Sphingobium sp. LB126]|uniref:MaoC family dehydratase n=1 Tax=Sphingobium sp. LB126 TaxID=1983755 RepID=UPI000C205646|nr:MaoC family dehydratase [Sphingobium sp. LB126]PJG49570.1 acyl dehydratase [Sphingobium sp. LB126]